jgi:hypothetical protein
MSFSINRSVDNGDAKRHKILRQSKKGTGVFRNSGPLYVWLILSFICEADSFLAASAADYGTTKVSIFGSLCLLGCLPHIY